MPFVPRKAPFVPRTLTGRQEMGYTVLSALKNIKEGFP